MLHITLGNKQAARSNDALGRAFFGFDESMTPEELYNANRGCWVLGARADEEQYALLSFDGTVRQAIEIDRIVPIPQRNRRALEGRVLHPGHPVYDKYVNKPSRVKGVRNPITYFDDEEDRTCACGCGADLASARDFLPGHDQRAIHDRIAKVGSVKSFLQWFGATYQDETAA